jgi:hypothetical protein
MSASSAPLCSPATSARPIAQDGEAGSASASAGGGCVLSALLLLQQPAKHGATRLGTAGGATAQPRRGRAPRAAARSDLCSIVLFGLILFPEATLSALCRYVLLQARDHPEPHAPKVAMGHGLSARFE